jgi:hypothetical protein
LQNANTRRPNMAITTQGGSFHTLQADAASTVASGMWHAIVGTYDGSQMALWLNGRFAGSLSASGPMDYGSSGDIAIGQRSVTSPGEYFGGFIECALVASRAWSPAEIALWTTQPYCMFKTDSPVAIGESSVAAVLQRWESA